MSATRSSYGIENQRPVIAHTSQNYRPYGPTAAKAGMRSLMPGLATQRPGQVPAGYQRLSDPIAPAVSPVGGFPLVGQWAAGPATQQSSGGPPPHWTYSQQEPFLNLVSASAGEPFP
jgi:hypothetical protein